MARSATAEETNLTITNDSQGTLNPRRQRFVEEYLIDANGTQAAIRAGYSPKTAHVQGSRLLTDVKVRTSIDEGLARLSERARVSAEWVTQKLLDLHEQAKAEGQLAVAVRALELLGRHLGMFIERREITAMGRVEVVMTRQETRVMDGRAVLVDGADGPKAIEG